ncbi:hypothetical protein QYF36_001758 [Acer negundo]|nr:hypothetical protein QYF36_001758 [Acer negundo]
MRAFGPFQKINHCDQKGIQLPTESNDRRDDAGKVRVLAYKLVPVTGLREIKTCQGSKGSVMINGRNVGGKHSIDTPMVEVSKQMDEEKGDMVADRMALAIDFMATNNDNLVIDERVGGPGPLPKARELENYGLRRETSIGVGLTKQKIQKESLEIDQSEELIGASSKPKTNELEATQGRQESSKGNGLRQKCGGDMTEDDVAFGWKKYNRGRCVEMDDSSKVMVIDE